MPALLHRGPAAASRAALAALPAHAAAPIATSPNTTTAVSFEAAVKRLAIPPGGSTAGAAAALSSAAITAAICPPVPAMAALALAAATLALAIASSALAATALALAAAALALAARQNKPRVRDIHSAGRYRSHSGRAMLCCLLQG